MANEFDEKPETVKLEKQIDKLFTVFKYISPRAGEIIERAYYRYQDQGGQEEFSLQNQLAIIGPDRFEISKPDISPTVSR